MPPAVAPRPPQTLFLVLDAVPHAMMAKLHERGACPGFQRPTRVVSTFPSLTECALTGLFRPLGASKAWGYEGGHFDAVSRRFVTGGLTVHRPGEPPPMEAFFDVMRHGTNGTVTMYVAPFTTARNDLKKIAPLIEADPGRQSFFCYIGSTDSTAHLDGVDTTERLVREIVGHVDRVRADYQAAYGQPLHVVLFSDHGFAWGRKRGDRKETMHTLDISGALRRAGLRLSDNLRRPHRVATVLLRNVNGVDLYAHPSDVPALAEALLESLGTDLVMTPHDDHILVQASGNGTSHETARIRAKQTATGEWAFAYEPEGTGDPLNYRQVVATLRTKNLLDADGYAAAGDWFAATHDHHYPDALYRIWDAFHGLVQQPASLLLSTLECFEFGGGLVRAGCHVARGFRNRLLGTHGALTAESSSAFLMTTDASVTLPPVARYDQALAPFAERVDVARR